MSYRDDREALRQRAEQLEGELAAAQRELAAMRREGSASLAEARTPPQAESSRGGVWAGLLVIMGVVIAAVGETPPAVGIGAALALAGLWLGILSQLLRVTAPYEALVIAGRRTRLPDGSLSNFAVVRRPRIIRRPFVETCRTLDLRAFPITVTIQNGYCRGGIAVQLVARGCIKISSEPNQLRCAAERFLDQHASQVATAAMQTLEGSLREVVSQWSLAELDADWEKVRQRWAEVSAEDLDKLGLELVGLWLSSIDDEHHAVETERAKRVAAALTAAGLSLPPGSRP